MGARDLVGNPILLSPDEPGMPQLQFVALDAYAPRGTVVDSDEDHAVHSFPWFSEVIGRYRDRAGQLTDSWWCVTRMPVVGTDMEIFGACINRAPAQLFATLAGRDHGDALASVLKRDWPDIYSMFEASTAGDLSRRILLAVDTGQGQQWLVADVIEGQARHEITGAHLEDLIITALSVALRTSDWIVKLPGILELGPNYATRRREGIAGVLTGIADIGGAIAGLPNLRPDELASAAKAAEGLPAHLRSIFR